MEKMTPAYSDSFKSMEVGTFKRFLSRFLFLIMSVVVNKISNVIQVFPWLWMGVKVESLRHHMGYLGVGKE